MQQHRTILKFLGAVLMAMILGTGAPAWSQMGAGHMSGHKHGGKEGSPDADKGAMLTPHGGTMQMTDQFMFETVFTGSDIRIYLMNMKGMAVSPRQVKGTVNLQPEKGKAVKLALQWTRGTDDPMAANRVRPGAMVNDSLGYLHAAYDPRSVSDGSAMAHIMLSNLPVAGDKTAHWMAPYAQTPLFGMACPMHPEKASLTGGKCSECGMSYQPARVIMDMESKTVAAVEVPKPAPAQPRHSGH